MRYDGRRALRPAVHLAVLYLTSIATGAPSFAQTTQCVRPSIDQCPSLYAADCLNASFVSKNLAACAEIAKRTAVDEESCKSFDQTACEPRDCGSVDQGDEIKLHFCQVGRPDCPTNLPEIGARFEDLTNQLALTLQPYEALISLDLKEVNGLKELCKFTRVDIDRLVESARSNPVELDTYRADLDSARQCNNLLTAYIEDQAIRPSGAATNNGLPPEVWSQMVDQSRAMAVDVGQRVGKIEGQITALEGAPAALRVLSGAHLIGCPQ